MSKLNLKFKIYNELLVSNIRGPIIFSCPGSILNLKFSVRFWSVTIGVNHFAMSRLNLKFKIDSELLVSDIGGSIIFPCQS